MEEKKEKKKGRGNPQNLRTPTSEEARIIGRKGGLASAQSRRNIKSIAEAIKAYLGDLTEIVKEDGSTEMVTNAFAIAIAQVEKAKATGDTTAAVFVRDTSGEKPKDTVGLSADEGKIDVSIQIVDGNGNKA